MEKIDKLQQSMKRKDLKIAELEDHILSLDTWQQIYNKNSKFGTENNNEIMLDIKKPKYKIQKLQNKKEELKDKTASKQSENNNSRNSKKW